MLAASEGTFSFSIAICNSPSLRDYLIGKLREEYPSIAIVKINKEVTDIFDFVSRNITGINITGVFIIDVETIVSSDEKEQKVLQVLNATREAWRSHFSCPVVFWAAEYVARLLSIHSRDLWSWVSHSFEFVSERATASAGMMDIFSGDITLAGRFDADEKRFRIAELEQRIAEAGNPPKAELVPYVLNWLNELAYILYAIGMLTEAEKMLKKELEINERIGQPVWMAASYGNLGLIYRRRGDLDKAEEMHKKSLEIEEKLGRLEGIAMQYGNLGLIYQTRGELDKAEQMLREGLKIDEKLGRLAGIASKYGNLGLIYRERGDLDKAEEMHKKSLEIDKRIGQPGGMASQYGNLGLIYQTRGELDKAEQMFSRSLEIDERLGRLEGMVPRLGAAADAAASGRSFAIAREKRFALSPTSDCFSGERSTERSSGPRPHRNVKTWSMTDPAWSRR